MDEHFIDTILRVRLEQRVGHLAQLATILADNGALIGEITTVRETETAIVRDILIATVSDEQTQRVISAITASGMEVLQTHDTVFEVHRGGKIHSGSRVETGTLRDLRSIYTPGVARVARAIEADVNMAWDFTMIGNSVGNLHERLPRPRPGRYRAGRVAPLKKGASTSTDELLQYARDHLAHFKAPHGVTIVSELPKTATGKVQKYVLRGGRAAIAKV